MKSLPSQIILRNLFSYNPDTGDLIRKRTNVRLSGVVEINGRTFKVSRVIWKWMTGKDPYNTVDHKDRNHFNNRWNNLRDATYIEQNINRIYPVGISGHRGIYLRGNRFYTNIRINGVRVNLGTYDTLQEAIVVRLTAEQRRDIA